MLIQQRRFLLFIVLLGLLGVTSSVGRRNRRSPFKKHQIIIESDKGWSERPAPPPPPPPPQQSDETIIHHHHQTVVEHHHHHVHVPPRPPPRPPQHEGGGFRIEINKGKGKGNKGEKEEEIKKAIEEAKEAFERDKKEKLERFKGDVEETFDFLAKIPEQFASDMEIIGSKIKEDLDKKKEEEKNKGISIQIWKGKGKGGGHGSRVRGDSGESTEVVHHHYHGSSEEGVKPSPFPPPSRAPPKKSYEDMNTGFLSFLDQASSSFRVPFVEEERYSDESSGYGHGGNGKGFQFRVWKGGRRR